MPFSSVLGASSVIRPGVCTSTTRPTVPYDGQVIYETDTDTLSVYDGTGWVSLNPVNRDRNVVINGAMQVHQRGTSVASITTSGYRTADRWLTAVDSLGTWTQTVENDAPTGSGFRKSIRMLCTTANASPASTNTVQVIQYLEGQNCQQFFKGTPSARSFMLTFWVKSNVTGTYAAELNDNDNGRYQSLNYTISSSGVWERKSLRFAADTTGVLDNDNNLSLFVRFWLGSGSAYTTGSQQSSWVVTSSNLTTLAPSQVNVAAATNNYWQITGVQLEAGSVATPFEFEDYGTTLQKCKRYYWRNAIYAGGGVGGGGTVPIVSIQFPVTMRVAPTFGYISNGPTMNGIVDETITGLYSPLPSRDTTADGTELLFTKTGAAWTSGQGVTVKNVVMEARAEL